MKRSVPLTTEQLDAYMQMKKICFSAAQGRNIDDYVSARSNDKTSSNSVWSHGYR